MILPVVRLLADEDGYIHYLICIDDLTRQSENLQEKSPVFGLMPAM